MVCIEIFKDGIKLFLEKKNLMAKWFENVLCNESFFMKNKKKQAFFQKIFTYAQPLYKTINHTVFLGKKCLEILMQIEMSILIGLRKFR